MGRPFLPLEERIKRFWSYVEKTEDHWLWHGKIDRDGYGDAWWNHKQQKAHRVAYEIATGESYPRDIVLHHKPECPKNCVRPDHLKPMVLQKHSSIHTTGRKSRGVTYRRTEVPLQS